MGLRSTNTSITRYKVEGKLAKPVLETVAKGLKQHCISDIDNEIAEQTVGWTSLMMPYQPNFDDGSFQVGAKLVFALRIDRKKIPPKVIQKHYLLEMNKQLAQNGRTYLSRTEKKRIKEQITNRLSRRIPATPNIYDLVWDYEQASLWFFSNLKAANEELETLFAKSFQLTLLRVFPYTLADRWAGLSPTQRDQLNILAPAKFTR